MKSKDMRMTLLLDYYGQILTDKQKEVMELYYNEDLSLAEIAEHSQITRQGVRDSIKRGEAYILELENKLKLVEKITSLENTIKALRKAAYQISEINKSLYYAKQIDEKAAEIIKLADEALSNDEVE